MSQTRRTRIPTPTPSVREGRIGTGEPLLLLHPFTTSHDVWADVVPALAEEFDVVAATLPGHWGGPALPRREVSLHAYADGVERLMDELGWDTAHLAGNSIGGWLSLELARRGRARSVTAIAPAGGWTRWSRNELTVGAKFLGLYLLCAVGHALGDRVTQVPTPVRRTALRLVSHRPAAVPRERADRFLLAATRCPSFLAFVARELQETTVVDLTGVDDDVPIRLVLCEHDLLLPPGRYGRPYAEQLPAAEVVELDGVGHIPMFEDPERVAAVIGEHARRHGAVPRAETA